jgi:hypothetical protein
MGENSQSIEHKITTLPGVKLPPQGEELPLGFNIAVKAGHPAKPANLPPGIISIKDHRGPKDPSGPGGGMNKPISPQLDKAA